VSIARASRTERPARLCRCCEWTKQYLREWAIPRRVWLLAGVRSMKPGRKPICRRPEEKAGFDCGVCDP
jgi:hypothetical protein